MSAPEQSNQHVRKNLRHWERSSEDYQARHGPQLRLDVAGWGVWQLPEAELRILGDVRGRDALEFGCGAAQWSIYLAGQGARPVGLDLSGAQLRHGRRLMAIAGVYVPLAQASAEDTPFAAAAFDIVFCDHGAMTFADPFRTVPEAARVLRPGGLFAFNMGSPFADVCWPNDSDQIDTRLHNDYFDMRRFTDADTTVFQLPYGEWIRLFRRNGLLVEDLVELRPPPDATTTYGRQVEWARRWPEENIWKLRREG